MNTKIIIAGIVMIVLVIVILNVWKPGQDEPQATPEPTITASALASPTPVESPAPAPKITTQMLTAGQGASVKAGDTISVLYAGKLTDGTVFDASSKHNNEPLAFTVGSGQLIKGFDEGVVGMKLGEKRRITIPPELGYGASGVPQAGIPANATLIFDVELKAINPPSPAPTTTQ